MRRATITEKLILYFLLLSLAAIIVVGSYSYISSRNALMKRTYDQLTSVRLAKKNNIEHFFNSRINEIQLIRRSDNILKILDCLKNARPENKKKLEESLSQEYNNYLSKYFKESGYYSKLYIINSSGNLMEVEIGNEDSLTLCNSGSLEPYRLLNEIENNVKKSGEPQINDYQKMSGDKWLPLLISAPVFDTGNKYCGFISIAIKPGAIDEIMLEKDPMGGLGNTGESYLVGPDSLMRSQSRFIPKSILTTKVNTPGVSNALNGKEGAIRLLDYRRTDVFNSHGPLHIPGLNWVILAEIDYKEAMIPLTNIRNEILILTIFLSMLVFVAISFIARKISRPIIKLKKAAENIGKGNFDTHLEITSTDEIGTLTDTFNKMALHLKNMTGDLKEREERLKHFYKATLDGILLHDEGKPVLINQAILKLTDFSEEEMMKMNISEIIDFEPGCGPEGIPEKPFSCETLLKKKEGSHIPVEIQFSSIEYYGKLITAAVIRDISKRVKIEKELHDERLKRLSSVIDGQEIERERLSRELHDGLGQELIAIKLKLESTVEHADEKTQKIIGDLRNEFNRTIDEIRRMSNDLMPSGLQEFGLANAIRKLCNNISENSDIITVVGAENFTENLDNKITMYLYRIVQEAINNSVKHAQASEIRVILSSENQFICLSIIDNGKGFNFDNNYKFSGNGIYNMRERVNMLNGKIEINTSPGSGTVINIQVPIN